MDLQTKILSSFQGMVVRKDLAFLVKGGLPVPTYVLEYLLAQYCATDNEDMIHEGVEKVKEIIRNNYVHRAESEKLKGYIREQGRHSIIDKITVVLNERADEYQATFSNLGLRGVPIGTQYVKANPKLLSGNGVWCIVTVGYLSGEDIKTRWEIENLKPIQIANVDTSHYVNQRSKFTTEEWLYFLMHTVGLNPEKFNRREILITLCRLLPHIENNYNFIELGPKGTGKSHVFQELSPFGVLVSGGDVTSPRLFVKIQGNKEILGLVGYWDVVAWDEFEQQKGRNVEAVLIDTMQNYLANKSFNRGKATHEASASICFVGNTKHTVSYMLKNSHLFESIPTSFIKGAFLDRIHLYNPGWEIKMLKKDSFSKGYGLITDYIAAILHEMRNVDLTHKLDEYAHFDSSLSERDHLAIRKTFSGLIKLIYPDGNMTKEEAYELIDFATEGRKRVKDQLSLVDETFKAEPVLFRYIPNGSTLEVNVETLEKINNASIFSSEVAEPKGSLDEDSKEISIDNEQNNSTSIRNKKRTRIPMAKEGGQMFRLGQTGVTYKELFSPYLIDAKVITIEDPYIRTSWQIKNLMEFLTMLTEIREVDGLIINLHTNEEEDKTPELIDKLNDIQDELSSYGIEFNYLFKPFHDRCIKTDTGWLITLGRGLDIFEKYSQFSVAAVQQAKRKCKDFTISYNKM